MLKSTVAIALGERDTSPLNNQEKEMDKSKQHKLVRYFSQLTGKFGAYCNEEWCINNRSHVLRRAVSLPYGGGWQTMGVEHIGPCDGKKCTYYSTSNGEETRTEPLIADSIAEFDDNDLPQEFVPFT